jgi:hypothetical protein
MSRIIPRMRDDCFPQYHQPICLNNGHSIVCYEVKNSVFMCHCLQQIPVSKIYKVFLILWNQTLLLRKLLIPPSSEYLLPYFHLRNICIWTPFLFSASQIVFFHEVSEKENSILYFPFSDNPQTLYNCIWKVSTSNLGEAIGSLHRKFSLLFLSIPNRMLRFYLQIGDDRNWKLFHLFIVS